MHCSKMFFLGPLSSSEVHDPHQAIKRSLPSRLLRRPRALACRE